MDVLEKREALSDAKDAKDLAAVRALGEEAEAGVSRVERALAQAFAEGTQDTLKGKLGLLGELRFFRRFADEVSAVEEELIDAS
jgi:molecular chaperone HscB